MVIRIFFICVAVSMTVVGILSFIVQISRPVGFVSGHPLPHQLMAWQGITRGQVTEAEIVCSGHLQPTTGWARHVDLTVDGYTYTGVERRIAPFAVDHYWKGSGPGVVSVALFNSPPLIGDVSTFFTGRRVVLVLKKDATGSGAYQLVNIMESWLPIPENALAGDRPETPVRAIELGAVEGVESFANFVPPAESPGQYSLAEQALEPLYPALEALKSVGTSDPRTEQALQALYTNTRLDGGAVAAHSLAFDALNAIDPAQACTFALGLYRAGTLDENQRFQVIEAIAKRDPIEGCKLGKAALAAGPLSISERGAFRYCLGQAIMPSMFAQLDPAYLRAMVNGDHETEITVTEAMCRMATYGDARCVPWLGEFLDSKSSRTQYQVMGALRFLNFKTHFTPERLPTPVDPHNSSPYPREPYPEDLLAPYRAWVKAWLEVHPQDAIPL